ncbi:MAG: hypothetical protein CBD26_00235 [Candidatus Pelagibacter sp. TMED166]|nr:MAG: hypothetical protein CBD26_00235 [Candidatus Pelagibacter sp. TMED166]|tara:strand:+ start:6188 stop:8029 length:1842 start_codon:yes stop_codon:yes gene_type:complete
MADTSLFSRLRRLFSTNVVVRNVGGRKLKVSDTSRTQAYSKSNLVDRYQKIFTGAGLSGYSDALMTKSMRLNLFKDYEAMDSDAIISSALDIYSDESTMKSEYGEVLQIQTDNDQIKEILHNLFYDIVNIEFNLWPWIRNMCKYGDFFLKLEIDEKYGITNVVPLSVYDVSRLEGLDPENPEYVKFLIEAATAEHRYKQEQSSTKEELENYEVAHFRLLSDSNYLPYGKSQVEGARKIYKQLTLMEDAMLIHRIMRAPEKRVFKLDIGNIPPAEVDNYMQQVINKMKKAPVVDETTGDYNLKYNMQNITEDFFLPVRGGDSGTSIDSLPGLTYEATDDIEYLKNKLLSALRIPKAFLGFEDQIGSKATLAAEDVRFARTIERIQRITLSELTKIAIVHLYAQGYQDAELTNFELTLTNPSTIYEQEKIELWNNKTSLADSMLRDGLCSSEWIYKNIFNFTQEEIKEMDKQITFDYKTKFRRQQIEQEGNDPAESGESQGTPSDLALGRTGHELDDEGGSEEGGQPGAGRPKEPNKYGKDSGARGRDPLGAHDKKKGGSGAPKYGKALALSHYDSLKKSMNFNKKDREIITEVSELEEEYQNEVSSFSNDKSND